MSEKITMFVRRDGLVCYEVRLTYRAPRPVAEFAHGLLSSGLDWYWESEPSDAANAAPARKLTPLKPETADPLRADIEEQGTEHARLIHLFAVDPGVDLRPGDGLKQSLRDFMSHNGPVQIVISRMPDATKELVFVHADAPDRVFRILQTWGIHPGASFKRRGYRWLFTARLETQFGIEH